MRGRGLALGLVLAATSAGAAPAAQAPAAPTWDTAFATNRAPAALHFRAIYKDARGEPHALEVWRDGERRLRRRTDDALDLYVERRAAKNETADDAYTLVDHRRRTLARVSRTNLYRIGVFSDWAALAHVVARPAGPHRVVALGGAVEATAAGPCRTWRVERDGAPPDEICWSTALGLPLRIQRRDANGAAVTTFEVREAQPRLASPGVFVVDPAGLQVVDANADIDPASEH